MMAVHKKADVPTMNISVCLGDHFLSARSARAE